MLLRRPIREHQGRSMVLLADPTCIHFHYAHGFATQKLAHMLDSLVRVSRRDEWITDLLTLDNDFYVLDKNLSVTQLLAFFLIKNIEK